MPSCTICISLKILSVLVTPLSVYSIVEQFKNYLLSAYYRTISMRSYENININKKQQSLTEANCILVELTDIWHIISNTVKMAIMKSQKMLTYWIQKIQQSIPNGIK